MGSVSSVNPGVSDLLQTLTNLNSPVMSSQKTVAALEKAPTADIVQLSMAATQLQGLNTMFGIASTQPTDMSNTLAALEGSATGSSVLSTASPAEQMANAQAALQAEFTQGLFGAGANNNLTGTLFNSLA